MSEDGPCKVVFSPDGHLAYVNHLRANAFDVVDVASHKIVQRVAVPSDAGGFSDEAISPDGKEIWLGMPNNGKTTTVVNAQTYRVEAVLDSGPRTNHPNFVTLDGVDYAYLTAGDLNQTWSIVVRPPVAHPRWSSASLITAQVRTASGPARTTPASTWARSTPTPST
ncbi:MAG TPA: hypothetical protein VFQ42_03110 [Mycobacterium sp.]|nr:hypothetical protein [Mycobacterium sp.]